MKNQIILDLATTLSITTGVLLIDNFVEIKIAMEEILGTILTDSGMLVEKQRVANYILENYPELEGLQVDKKAINTWLDIQKQTFGNEFVLLPINAQKKKVKTR